MPAPKNTVMYSPSSDHIYSTIYSVLENIVSEKSEREHRKLKNNYESGAVQYTVRRTQNIRIVDIQRSLQKQKKKSTKKREVYFDSRKNPCD